MEQNSSSTGTHYRVSVTHSARTPHGQSILCHPHVPPGGVAVATAEAEVRVGVRAAGGVAVATDGGGGGEGGRRYWSPGWHVYACRA